MRPVARRLLPPFALSLLVWACGGAPKPVVSIAPVASTSASASATAAAFPPPVSPARWVLATTGTTHQNARIDLAAIGAGKGTLYVGDAGERWMEPDDGRTTPIAAATLADDALVGVVARAGGGLTFVGRSGATFDADTPLGALTARGASPGPIGSLAVGNKSIVAVLMPTSPKTPVDGSSLARSVDGGKTWARFPGDPSFPKESQPTRVAMLPSGVGVALFHPQRAMVTLDDGARWDAIATLPVGARNVVADGNGEIVIEGFESSAVLRTTPTPHFEKVVRASRQGVDLSLGADASEESLSDAIATGHGALLGTRYAHVQAERDDSTRWTLTVGTLGEHAPARRIPELDRCNAVYVGGAREDGHAIELACDRTPAEPRTPVVGRVGYGGYGYGGEDYGMSASVRLELFRSEDGGKTFKVDGIAGASYRDARAIWVSPSGTTIIEGACKRMRTPDYICGESTAIVRPAGATGFAKVGGLHAGSALVDVAFSRDGSHAYAIEREGDMRLTLLVSRDGGLDFSRHPLPAQEDATRAGGLVRASGAWGHVGVDDASGTQRLTIAVAGDDGHAMIFASDDGGESIVARRPPFEPEVASVGGAHAFAFDVEGRAWESGDAGETWSHAGASKLLGAEGQATTCDLYGCILGARTTRIGWDHLGKGDAPIPTPPVAPKLVSAPTIECDAGGEWRPIPGAYGLPQIGNADLSVNDRWVYAKRDAAKGTIVAIVGTETPKGLEIKEIPLFGEAPADPLHYASALSLQGLGVAALRYAVRREEPVATTTATTAAHATTYRRAPPTPPTPTRKIVDGQIVDVEIAWYVAATGKVHRATIKGAGTLDTRTDVSDYGGNAPIASTGVFEITEGGIHVRPLASVGASVATGYGAAARRTDGPLYFVSDAGKVEKLDWPDLPAHDSAGRTINPDVSVARAGNRSIVTAVVGGRELFAAFSPVGTGATRDAGWTSATWGLYPDQPSASDYVRLRIVDLGGKPAAALMVPTGTFAEQALGISLDASTSEPQILGRWPTQADFAASLVGCSATATARMSSGTSVGHRRAVIVRGNGADGLFATSNASLRMVPGAESSSACVGLFEAQAIVSKSPTTSPSSSYRPSYGARPPSYPYPTPSETFTTLLWPDRAGATDKLEGSLFRWAASSTTLYERPLTCAVTTTPPPEELRSTYGFTR